jgi:VLRF1 release factor-like protein
VAGRGPGRWVEVAPERFGRWTQTFAARHGGVSAGVGPAVLTLRAADGAAAQCHLPFPPVPWPPGSPGADAGPDAAAGLAERAAAHAAASRTVGVLLVRLGGYAAGVFAGDPPCLLASKTGSRLVHGRSAAGGWSQRRFARRRENQAAQALSAAAGTAAAVLGPYRQRLDAVVLGGDRRAVSGLRSDPRLRPYLDRAQERFLTTGDPKLAVLRDTPRLFRAVRIYLTEPGEAR